jgi:hypothetical protein
MQEWADADSLRLLCKKLNLKCGNDLRKRCLQDNIFNKNARLKNTITALYEVTKIKQNSSYSKSSANIPSLKDFSCSSITCELSDLLCL